MPQHERHETDRPSVDDGWELPPDPPSAPSPAPSIDHRFDFTEEDAEAAHGRRP
jgi:hypothetical protein